ncbi:unnamed protein product [Bursaphelenchus okinawaensis]|uniref:Uncharacterized protein n=1 Tax=Bursaphelenchus okinawaensis TaxID=465554 RepID=A0A811JS04_9BILA|nr:unnamed protein product [Bursaphelenchus okinawaensis]CAG9080390.1 unnamed protein product [Bursaphelenchus okinawaensis]
MGKRKHEDSPEIIEDSFLKKVRFDETLASNGYIPQVNGYHGVQARVLEGIDVWLVRKPKSLSIDELKDISLPKKIKPTNCDKQVDTSLGLLDCELEKPSKSMFYFETPKERGDKNPKVPLQKKIKGIAWVKMPVEVEDPFPQAREEDFELMDIKVEDEDIMDIPFKVKSIRKKPDCSLSSKERLQAFGAGDSTEIGKRKKEKLKKVKKEKSYY